MKKSLIALAAMTAVAGAAQAQSSVTIYGIVDSGYLSTEQDTATATGKLSEKEAKGITSSASSSSRLGFRGTEDLGGGLRAEFVVETGLNATNATVSTFNNRQSFIGLSSAKAGTFRIGTQYTAHHTIAAAFSPSVGVNMAGDLNYSQGQSAGLLSTFGLQAAGTTLTTYTDTETASGNAKTLAANVALTKAGLNNGVLDSAGTGYAATPTTGIIVAAISGNIDDTTKQANANKALAIAQAALNSKAVADLNARLARVDSAGYTVRRNNTVSYATPVVNGLQLGLGYNAPTTDKTIGGSESKASSQSISLNYAAGKFAAAVAHSSGKTESNTVSTVTPAVAAGGYSVVPGGTAVTVTPVISGNPTIVSTSVVDVNTYQGSAVAATSKTTRVEVKGQETMAAASYDLGVAKLGYIYSARKAKDTVSDLLDRKSHSVSATVPLGKVTAWANYGIGDQKVAVVNDYDLKAMQVGARYAFSKRTDVYGIYGQTKMDNKGTGVDLKDTQYAVGVRHQF